MNLTRLVANFALFAADRAMFPNTGWVAVPLSEKVHPPILNQTSISGLIIFALAASENSDAGVWASIVTISKDDGLIDPNAKFR